jgi:hypothetical protein
MFLAVRRLRALLAAAAAAGALAVAPPLDAQQPSPPAADSVRAELRRLAALVDSLRAEVARLQAAGQEAQAQDALTQLRAAAEAAAAAGPRPAAPPPGEQEFSGRERSLQALNPEISVNADIFAHLEPDHPGSENFFAREFEISLISNLDPFSRAKVFIGRHVAGGEVVPFGGSGAAEEDAHGGEFEVEEGYAERVGLPGGLGLKLGRFNQQLGQVNRWHSHAFPFQSRPLPHLAFLGEEGLGQTGASLRWLAPFGGGSGTYEATVEVTRSENEALFGASRRPSVLGHLNGFWQLTRSTDLDFGVSWVGGRYEDEARVFDRRLFSAEASLTWRPPERAKYRGLNLRGGVLVLDGDRRSAAGAWGWGELRLNQSWLAGARYEWTENPADPDESARLFSPTLTWWQSEFVRIRAEYDLLGRTGESGQGRFLLQVTFAMGPHKHESY